MSRRRHSPALSLFAGFCFVLLLGESLAGCRSHGRHTGVVAGRDTTRGGGTPSSAGAARSGINDYNRQREALGNLDSLVTPAQPAVPRN